MKELLIIGYGVVGQTIHQAIEDKKMVNETDIVNQVDVCIYDPVLEKFELNTDLNYENFNDRFSSIFICVPTSINADINSVYFPDIVIDYLDTLVGIAYTGFVFVKSTILYEDIKQYRDKLKIVYWAEFLNELTAEQDFLADTVPLFGCETFLKKDVETYIKRFFEHIEDIRFESLETAINFKFVRNLYHSWKISFWNMIASHSLMDQRTLQQLMEKYPMAENMQLSSDGLAGFGGKCLPKDNAAFNDAVLNEKMVEEMLKRNAKIRMRSSMILKEV